MPRYSFEEDDEPPNLVSPQRQAAPPVYNPAAHPESRFSRMQAERQYSRAPPPQEVSPVSPPAPPIHRESVRQDPQGRYWGQQLGYTNSMSSNITPDADNFGERAGGGIAGIAMDVADHNARESGLEAMRNTPGYDPHWRGMESDDPPFDPRQNQRNIYSDYGERDPSPYRDDQPYMTPARPSNQQQPSQTSLTPLGAAAVPPAFAASQDRYLDPYADNPYNRYSRRVPALGQLDPNSIEDDGDDGLEYTQHQRGSMLSLAHNSHHSGSSGAAAAAAGGAAAGGVIGTLGGFVGRAVSGGRNASGPQYGPVSAPAPQTGYPGADGYDFVQEREKSQWLAQQTTGRKRMKWIIGIIVALLIAGGIAGGVAGGILSHKNSSSSSSSSSSSQSTASGDMAANGDLTKDSSEIKALMNNQNLHKVFPGIDYTPINTQYPACLTSPPSQNNVTRDLAVLSQLTNVVRLYGTDCNQTQMVLHGINALGLNGTLKVWLGVWQDTNTTTNARQLAEMYNILATYGTSPFVGAIVGNEILFRKDMTETQLGTLLDGVRSNFSSLGYNLPVATSDLGNSWTANLASKSDYVMSNVHPFFSGINAVYAATWTWWFWQTNDYGLKADLSKNYISETGWPSQGGMDCGAATSCTNGSVAGIQEMNTFMSDWVCSALNNGTNYFWFEAFDEPWKIMYDTPGKNWEDQWGLMDVNRNLKSGVSIPSCGGKTVPAA